MNMEFLIQSFRPALILICAMLLFNLPTLLYKIGFFLRGMMYLAFCTDKKWKKPQDPFIVFGGILKAENEAHVVTAAAAGNNSPYEEIIERKTIYFVRHGESTWNDTFNAGHRSQSTFLLGFIPGLIKACLFELYLILSGKLDSWFYDSPASTLGMHQVDELSQFLKKTGGGAVDDKVAQHVALLNGNLEAPASKILCSNLRRAVTTIVGGFKDRLARNNNREKILIVPSLQEISRNPDTLSITPAHMQIQASWIDKAASSLAICDFQLTYTNQVDMSLHEGNKPVGTNGLKRMREFCNFVFSDSVKENYIIVGGHSIWFRSFFQTFLPYEDNHVSKKKKLVNCGVVAFTLLKVVRKSGQPTFMVDPKSVEVVYGGFQ